MGDRPGPAPLLQVAALCTRRDGDGPVEVLLITSRDTGRWILPKGWPMKGRDLAEAAAREAWEEAGVRGTITPDPIGTYRARKITRAGRAEDCVVRVFHLPVDDLADSFPEAGQRLRRWIAPETAAHMVLEPELSALLRQLALANPD